MMATLDMYEETLRDRNDIRPGVRVVLVELPVGYHPVPGYPLWGSEFRTTGIVESIRGNAVFVNWGNKVCNVHLLEHLAVHHSDSDTPDSRVNPNHAFQARKRRNGNKT